MPYVRVKKRRKTNDPKVSPDWYKLGMRLLTILLTLATAVLVIWMVSCERAAPPPQEESSVGRLI